MSDGDERSTIRSGRNFEETYRLDTNEAGEFLIALGERLRDDDELTIVGDDWELPFAFGEPVELDYVKPINDIFISGVRGRRRAGTRDRARTPGANQRKWPRNQVAY